MDIDSLESLAEIASSSPGNVFKGESTRVRSAGRSSLSAEFDIERMAQRTERLALMCQAMWELLRERTGLTEEDLRKKIQEVDGRDGLQDGRIAQSAVDCPGCGRKAADSRNTCLYCGVEIPVVHIFAQR